MNERPAGGRKSVPSVTRAIWRQSPTTAAAQHGVARDLVVILTGGTPVPVYEDRDTLLVPDDFPWPLPPGAPVERMAWLAMYEMLEAAAMDREKAGRGGRDPRAILAKPRSGETSVRVATVAGKMKVWTPVNPQQRDGLGGRPVRRTPYTTDRVLSKLFDQYGSPAFESRVGVRRLTVWEIDRSSKGAVLCRLSTEEINEGETLKGQIHAAEQTIDRCGLGLPKYLIVATKMSGFTGVEERIDHRWLEGHLRSGAIRWVVAREPDRIGRDKVAVYTLYNAIKEKRVALYYHHPFGRQIVWSRDELQLDILHAFATNEGRTITRRTLSAHIRRWLMEGKGWGGSGPIGTQRDDENWLVPHERGMEYVNWLFREFVAQDVARTPGCRKLAEHSRERWGVSLHPERLRQLLQNRFYVDGHWHVNFGDWRVACRPVDWGAHAVPEPLFAKAQLLLRTNQSRKHTDLGESLLNYRPFMHAACMHVKVPKQTAKGVREEAPRLMAYTTRHNRSSNHGTVRYYHTPHPKELGCPECEGLGVPRTVDALVIRTLLQLARDRELQRLYAEQVARSDVADGGRPSEEQLADARLQVRRGEAKLEELDANPPGEAGPYREFGELEWSRLYGVWEKKLQNARGDLAELEAAAAEVPAEVSVLGEAAESDLVGAIERVLTVHNPQDQELRIARVALFKALVDRVVLHTKPEGWFIEIWGPIVPNGKRMAGPLSPVQAAMDELHSLVAAGLLDAENEDQGLNNADNSATIAAANEAAQLLVWEDEPPDPFLKHPSTRCRAWVLQNSSASSGSSSERKKTRSRRRSIAIATTGLFRFPAPCRRCPRATGQPGEVLCSCSGPRNGCAQTIGRSERSSMRCKSSSGRSIRRARGAWGLTATSPAAL